MNGEIKQYSLEWYKEMRKLNKDTIISLVESNGKQRDALKEQNKQLLDEIDMLKFQLKAADSVNEKLTENQIPEYLIEFVDDVKHMIKLYNNSSHTRSEEYRNKLAEKLDDIRTIDLKP